MFLSGKKKKETPICVFSLEIALRNYQEEQLHQQQLLFIDYLSCVDIYMFYEAGTVTPFLKMRETEITHLINCTALATRPVH